MPQFMGVRWSSGVPGLPIFEFDRIPLQPYSQPSGPHTRPFATLCTAFKSNPSSSTCAGPSGTSSPLASGMNSSLGMAVTKMPPNPYSTEL